MSRPDERQMVHLAIGRLFRMMSRPGQPDDAAEYQRLRGIILDCSDGVAASYQVSYTRDRLMGAQGDA